MHHARHVLAALGVALFLAPSAARAETVPACTESGIASYYGPGFHGLTTASGEIFDSAAMTAAHPTLPLGTEVEVSREGDDTAIEVTINDRGPYIDDRIIDLSEGAAAALGMIEEGVVPVTVAIYVEDQSDPDVRVALLAAAGGPVRRPGLLRLGGPPSGSDAVDDLCGATASVPADPPRDLSRPPHGPMTLSALP